MSSDQHGQAGMDNEDAIRLRRLTRSSLLVAIACLLLGAGIFTVSHALAYGLWGVAMVAGLFAVWMQGGTGGVLLLHAVLLLVPGVNLLLLAWWYRYCRQTILNRRSGSTRWVPACRAGR